MNANIETAKKTLRDSEKNYQSHVQRLYETFNAAMTAGADLEIAFKATYGAEAEKSRELGCIRETARRTLAKLERKAKAPSA